MRIVLVGVSLWGVAERWIGLVGVSDGVMVWVGGWGVDLFVSIM